MISQTIVSQDVAIARLVNLTSSYKTDTTNIWNIVFWKLSSLIVSPTSHDKNQLASRDFKMKSLGGPKSKNFKDPTG